MGPASIPDKYRIFKLPRITLQDLLWYRISPIWVLVHKKVETDGVGPKTGLDLIREKIRTTQDVHPLEDLTLAPAQGKGRWRKKQGPSGLELEKPGLGLPSLSVRQDRKSVV